MGLELVSPWIKSKVNFRVPGFESQRVHQYMGVSFTGRTTHFDCVDVCSSQATPAKQEGGEVVKRYQLQPDKYVSSNLTLPSNLIYYGRYPAGLGFEV